MDKSKRHFPNRLQTPTPPPPQRLRHSSRPRGWPSLLSLLSVISDAAPADVIGMGLSDDCSGYPRWVLDRGGGGPARYMKYMKARERNSEGEDEEGEDVDHLFLGNIPPSGPSGRVAWPGLAPGLYCPCPYSSCMFTSISHWASRSLISDIDGELGLCRAAGQGPPYTSLPSGSAPGGRAVACRSWLVSLSALSFISFPQPASLPTDFCFFCLHLSPSHLPPTPSSSPSPPGPSPVTLGSLHPGAVHTQLQLP